jgi:hypothetical protein
VKSGAPSARHDDFTRCLLRRAVVSGAGQSPPPATIRNPSYAQVSSSTRNQLPCASLATSSSS